MLNIGTRTKSGNELIIDHVRNYSGAILECVEIGSRKFPGRDIGLLTIVKKRSLCGLWF